MAICRRRTDRTDANALLNAHAAIVQAKPAGISPRTADIDIQRCLRVDTRLPRYGASRTC